MHHPKHPFKLLLLAPFFVAIAHAQPFFSNVSSNLFTGTENKTAFAPLVQNSNTVSIVTHPSNVALCEGGNAVFSVVAVGQALTYQWQISTDSGNTFININGNGYTGAITPSLIVNAITSAQNQNKYRCIVNCAASCTPETSASATLTVRATTKIIAHPTSKTICALSNTSFNIAAEGVNLQYLWQVSNSSTGSFVNIQNNSVYSGQHTATLQITGATIAHNGQRYRCAVIGLCGSNFLFSSIVLLTVAAPVSISTQPTQNTTVCSNHTANISLAAVSTQPISYQWQVSIDSGLKWTNLTEANNYHGTNTASLSILNTPVAFNKNKYQAIVSNSVCIGTVASSPAALWVNTTPVVQLVTHNNSLTAGQKTILTNHIHPAIDVNIAWYHNNTLIPNATGKTLHVDVEKLGNYKTIVTDVATNTCTTFSNNLSIVAAPSNKLFAFPSPNNGRFTISYYSKEATVQRIVTIYNSIGLKVYQNTFQVAQAYHLLPINLSQFDSGVYRVVLRDANGATVESISIIVSY
jgi:hypothetical protein